MLRFLFSKTFIILTLFAGCVWFFFHRDTASHEETTTLPEKFPITLSIDRLFLPATAQRDETTEQFFNRNNININDGDIVDPPRQAKLTPHTHITLITEKHYTIKTKNVLHKGKTTLFSVRDILDREHIIIDPDDIVTPERDASIVNEEAIVVIAVDIREETVTKPIPFKTEEREDDELSWRKRIIEQKGKAGIRAFTYRIVSHDSKDLKKTLIDEKITQDPITEKIRQGTLVKTGKSHKGLSSWYSFTGTLSAANPWLPIGSYVRVTNTENGKSVIVRINDRGPFGKGRIIDLDRVAFEKIASLGAGVVSVKMEEITN